MICGGIFDLASKEDELKKLENLMEDSQFWDDSANAKKIIAKSNALKKWIIPYRDAQSRYLNIKELLPEAEKENDNSLIEDLYQELDTVEKLVVELEVMRMLSGELDPKDCFLTINSGAGGTESCDWAEMLSRMYQRWAVKKGWKAEIIDRVDGEVAGIKSITFKLSGDFAYGYSKSEKGVHRLVRISPFDSNARRHTSFASVDVTPIIDDEISIEIKPEDIRIDTYRASGAGGQHVNKTDSAVRVTHTPTNIVVSCQKERSQMQNKEMCMKMLKSKLYEKEVTERENALKKIGGEKKEISWGSQIRNYVFHPYSLVKDARTKVETGNIQAVMDGEIDDFVNAYLREFGA
jgi:peptide chain release factor 2